MHRSIALAAFIALLFFVNAHAQCDPPLDPLDDGSGAFGAVGLPAVVISEIKPGPGGYIEYFNTTAAPFNVSPWWLCSPFDYAGAGLIMVPAGGYVTIPWPANFSDTATGGEVILYKSSLFGTNTEILDFVCWGVNPHGSRITQAVAVGKWSGACCAALTNGAIHRKIGTKGTVAADYDVTSPPSPMNCTPGPTGVGNTPPLASAHVSASPNPFSTTANIRISLTVPTRAQLAVYSVDGRRVRLLDKAEYPVGPSNVAWDGTDDAGNRVASGVYVVRFEGERARAVARVTILR